MSIRRQSIISSLVIYTGFAVGLMNTYLFTRQGGFHSFSQEEYGLYNIIIAITTMMSTIAVMAMPSYIFKFAPYYNEHLPERRNDMLTWALVVSCIGFFLVVIAGWSFKHLVIRKFGKNSPLLITYYYWIFPLGFGLTIYTVLEAFAWSLHKGVITNFFREVQWRLFTAIIIVLYLTNVVKDFDLFIKLFAFSYPSIALGLFLYLAWKKKFHLSFRISKVTRRYFSKILALCTFVYSGTLVFTISLVFDTLVIASLLDNGTAKAGIYGLAATMTAIIQAPQRGIISASIAHLSKAWKDKDHRLLQKIYQRSSINQLIFACAIFLLIWLNFSDGIHTFQIKPAFLEAADIFFLLGLTKIIDMGTGVNAQTIATSHYWKFELISGVLLLVIMLPLTYILTKSYGLIGPAIGSLVSITIYNIIRIIFLYKKFKLFPLTWQSLYTVILAGASYFACYFMFRYFTGITAIALRSVAFIFIYGMGVIYLKLTPDTLAVWGSVMKKWRR